MGDNLRRLRGMHGLSQEKLCVQFQRMGCDIGRTTYAKYEAGELNIRTSVLIALNRFMTVPMTTSFWGWMSYRKRPLCKITGRSQSVEELGLYSGAD